MQLYPDDRGHFTFSKLVSTCGVLADVRAFAVGTRSWVPKGMVEITAGRGVEGVAWRSYEQTVNPLRSFGSYRCMATGNLYGAFCERELAGSG